MYKEENQPSFSATHLIQKNKAQNNKKNNNGRGSAKPWG